MTKNSKVVMGLLLAASALATPQMAMADVGAPHKAKKAAAAAISPREAALLARLEKLEAEMAALRADAAGAKAQAAEGVRTAQVAEQRATAATQVAQSASVAAKDAGVKLAAAEKKPAPEGMRSGSSTIKLGGFLKLNASVSHFDQGTVATNALGRDFYLPQQIPVGGTRNQTATDFSAKQTRLWLNLDTAVAGHSVKGYLETDFQTTQSAAQSVSGGGSQRVTSGYTLALRRAYLQVDKFTFGQDWSTFMYTGALPETTDFLGTSEGVVFVRQPLVRYSTPLGKSTTLHVAVENPESATSTLGAAALVENGTDRLPDLTARLAHTGPKGEVSLALLGRQIRTEVAATGAAATASGFGASLGGKLFLNEKKTSDLRFLATYGQNIGRYLGVNFAPDAVYVPTTNSLADVKVFAALAAARVALSPTVRMNVMGSIQSVDYDKSLALASIAAYNKKAWSGAVNLFYSPVKAVDLGVEYRHGERELVNGGKGAIDRFEFAAKYSF